MKTILFALLFLFGGCAFSKPMKSNFVEPTLINGRPANPAEWPASVYVDVGGGRCTGTIVGPSTMLIAAHCIKNGGTAKFSVGPNAYSAVCTHSKDYATNATADYTLCKVSTTVSGILYESVTLDDTLVKVGSELLLTGYGCTVPGGTGGNDGIYRIGEAKVQAIPSGTSNDIVTDHGGALCFGDSGGPAFFFLDTAKSKRVVVSVNSRGDIAKTSYLSAVYTPMGKRFIGAWQAVNPGQKICGIDKDTQNCRNDSGVPSIPEPKPEKLCSAEFKELAKCFER